MHDCHTVDDAKRFFRGAISALSNAVKIVSYFRVPCRNEPLAYQVAESKQF